MSRRGRLLAAGCGAAVIATATAVGGSSHFSLVVGAVGVLALTLWAILPSTARDPAGRVRPDPYAARRVGGAPAPALVSLRVLTPADAQPAGPGGLSSKDSVEATVTLGRAGVYVEAGDARTSRAAASHVRQVLAAAGHRLPVLPLACLDDRAFADVHVDGARAPLALGGRATYQSGVWLATAKGRDAVLHQPGVSVRSRGDAESLRDVLVAGLPAA